jgi:hypothetical protein
MHLHHDGVTVAKTLPCQYDGQQECWPLPDAMWQKQFQHLVILAYEQDGKDQGAAEGKLGLLPPGAGHPEKEDCARRQQHRLQGLHVTQFSEAILPIDLPRF